MLVNIYFQKWSKVPVTDYDETIYTKIYKGYTRQLSLDHVTVTGYNIKWDCFEILASGKSDYHFKVKETFFTQDFKPSVKPSFH